MKTARGFSLVIVLMLLVAAFAVVFALSDLVVDQKYATASVGREPMARAIAETCADRAASLASGLAPTGDFDKVLDPDGPRVFVPADARVVQLPAHAADAFHSYALLTADDGFDRWCTDSGCGACLFRFDDNSDDGVARATGDTTFDADGTEEGTVDTDVFTRDRDRAIVVTAIGIYPVSERDDVYDAARTRVTIKRFVANAPGAATPGVWVGEKFSTDNGKICGAGGVTADEMNFRNAPCICGALNGARSRDPETCRASDCSPVSCDAQVAGENGGGQQDPDVVVPEADGPARWVDGHWYADPAGTTVGTPADDSVWNVYVRVATAPHRNRAIGGTYRAPGHGLPAAATDDVDLFVWDTSEDAPDSLHVRCARNDDPAAPRADLCSDDSRWNLDALDCRTHVAATVARPCLWSGSGASAEAVCAEGESPCWKPVQSFGFASDDNAAGPGFKPDKTQPIPQLKDTSLRWTSRGGCTAGGACTGETILFVRSDGTLKTRNDLSAQKLPQPLVLLHEGPSSGGVSLIRNFGSAGSGRSDLIRLSVFTTGDFDVPEGATFAGALCAAGPATPALLKDNGSCTATGASALGLENGRCFAVRALGRCALTNNLGVLGHLRCDTISVNNTGCMVGGLSATAGSTGDVASSPCPEDAGISVLSNPNVIGDITSTGSVCVRNNIVLQGDIQTEGSVYLQGVKMDGQIIAEKNVDLKNDVQINVTDPLTFETGALETTAWLESSW